MFLIFSLYTCPLLAITSLYIYMMQDGRAEPSPAGQSLFIQPEPPEQGYVSHIILFLFILVDSSLFFNHVQDIPSIP